MREREGPITNTVATILARATIRIAATGARFDVGGEKRCQEPFCRLPGSNMSGNLASQI